MNKVGHQKNMNNKNSNQDIRILNRVERVWLASGLIGMIITNPREAVEKKCIELNQQGYQAHQIMPHGNFNILALLGQLALLVVTLGLFTFTPGYMILFKKA